MPLVTVGTSHHVAPIDFRERLAVSQDRYGETARQLCALPAVEEAVVLSTCNRTEIYALGDGGCGTQLAGWLRETGGFEESQLSGRIYAHQGSAAVGHLFRVASGLESLVLGEPQILGQIKTAWHAARDAGCVHKYTDRLFQQAFAVAKSVRSGTGINEHPVSVAYTAMVLARQIFGTLRRQSVLLIGAGEMIELCGRHLRDQGVARLVIANRSLERAETLASEFDARAIPLSDLDAQLPESDIVISSTASPEPIIQPDQVRAALKRRRHRPMFLVDIAVPRDIEPSVAELKDVYLYTIDDLQRVVDENMHHRQSAAESASQEVDEAVEAFMCWLHGARAASHIERLRKAADEHAADLARRAVSRLEAGGTPDEVVEQLANTLTHRLLHGPTVRLRQAAEREDYDMLRAADWLFEDGDEP